VPPTWPSWSLLALSGVPLVAAHAPRCELGAGSWFCAGLLAQEPAVERPRTQLARLCAGSAPRAASAMGVAFPAKPHLAQNAMLMARSIG
jgi:hypothetical protein